MGFGTGSFRGKLVDSGRAGAESPLTLGVSVRSEGRFSESGSASRLLFLYGSGLLTTDFRSSRWGGEAGVGCGLRPAKGLYASFASITALPFSILKWLLHFRQNVETAKGGSA